MIQTSWTFTQKLSQYFILMRLHKPIGIFLLLWPTLWALWIAGNGHPQTFIVGIFVLGVIFMRTAGCIINDIADKKFDADVTRTKDRPLASGIISVKAAILLFFILCIAAFTLVLLLNWQTLLLAIPALLLASFYPLMKRYIHWPQLILGIAFSWSIPMTYAALDQPFSLITWLLFAASVLWTVAYDTEYAMCDREDDLKIGIKSTAILFGSLDRTMVAILQISTLVILSIIGWLQHYSFWFYSGLSVAALLIVYQQFLIFHRKPQQCLQAFLNNIWFGAVIFIGLLLALL